MNNSTSSEDRNYHVIYIGSSNYIPSKTTLQQAETTHNKKRVGEGVVTRSKSKMIKLI